MRVPTIGRAAILAVIAITIAAVAGPRAPARASGVPAPQPASRAGQDTTITPAMIALGDSIYRGRVAGGTCIACHGPAAKGIPGLAPDLTDTKWLHGDGGLAFLARIIESGVPRPKEAAAAMPSAGGARLSPAQLRAVAAWVYALSHPEVRRTP